MSYIHRSYIKSIWHYEHTELDINPCVLLCVDPFIQLFHFFSHNYTVARQLAIDLGTNEDGTAPVGMLSHMPRTLLFGNS